MNIKQLFDSSLAVGMAAALNELRMKKVRFVHIKVAVSAVMNMHVDGKESLMTLDFCAAKYMEMSDRLLATATPLAPDVAVSTVVLNVSAGACPSFAIDTEKCVIAGSVSMNQRPCYFEVPIQFIESISVGSDMMCFSQESMIRFIIDKLNQGTEVEVPPAAPVKRPTLTVVK